MNNSLILTAQNHPKLKNFNIISLLLVAGFNIFLLILNINYLYVQNLSPEWILFVINILFYFIAEDQRQLIIKYRVFTVYIFTGLINLYCILSLFLWIRIGAPFYFITLGGFLSWFLSIIWILVKSA